MPRQIALAAGKDPLLELGGGHSAYVRAHCRAIEQVGLEPHVFCASDRSQVLEADFGVVHRIRSAVPFHPRPPMGSAQYLPLSPLHNLQLASAVTRFLFPRSGPRLIHGFGVWGGAAVRARDRLRRRGVPAAAIVSAYSTNRHESRGKRRGLTSDHGSWRRLQFRAESLWVESAVNRLERRALMSADAVLINYESVRRLLPPLPRTCLKLPYAPEIAFSSSAPEEGQPLPGTLRGLGCPTDPLIVAVSRHDPRKGIDILLKSLAALRRQGVGFRACLVGGGSLLVDHRRLATRLDLDDVTAIEGFVENVSPYLRSADVFVLPSLEEGSGSLALLEALRAGCAVVASQCDGIPEDVTDGDSAILVPPGEAVLLASALSRVLQNVSLRQELARRARETFSLKFSPAAFAEGLASVYRALAERFCSV